MWQNKIGCASEACHLLSLLQVNRRQQRRVGAVDSLRYRRFHALPPMESLSRVERELVGTANLSSGMTDTLVQDARIALAREVEIRDQNRRVALTDMDLRIGRRFGGGK